MIEIYLWILLTDRRQWWVQTHAWQTSTYYECTSPLTTAPRGLIPYRVYIVQYNLTISFSVPLLSVLRGHSVFSSAPQGPMTSDVEGFSIQDFIHYIYFPILILEKEPVFPFLMFSAKQGNYLVPIVFITSLVWRGLWLGIEPGTSRTRSHYSTTRLSRRRYNLTITCITWHSHITLSTCLCIQLLW